jgi:hypothetical protein
VTSRPTPAHERASAFFGDRALLVELRHRFLPERLSNKSPVVVWRFFWRFANVFSFATGACGPV